MNEFDPLANSLRELEADFRRGAKEHHKQLQWEIVSGIDNLPDWLRHSLHNGPQPENGEWSGVYDPFFEIIGEGNPNERAELFLNGHTSAVNSFTTLAELGAKRLPNRLLHHKAISTLPGNVRMRIGGVSGWIRFVFHTIRLYVPDHFGRNNHQFPGVAFTMVDLDPFTASAIAIDCALSGEPPVQVKLRTVDDQPLVEGVPQPKLTQAEYDCIQALIDSRRDGLDRIAGDELDKKSGHPDAHKILKSLIAKNPAWTNVLLFPNGKKGKGYGVA